MSNITTISARQPQTSVVKEEGVDMSTDNTLKKTVHISLSIFFSLGMVLSYLFGAPWLVTFGFFALSIAPLFSLWKTGDDHKNRIKE